jgi:hypothetical protein
MPPKKTEAVPTFVASLAVGKFKTEECESITKPTITKSKLNLATNHSQRVRGHIRSIRVVLPKVFCDLPKLLALYDAAHIVVTVASEREQFGALHSSFPENDPPFW